MSNGKYRTLDEFGWTSGLTPSSQRVKVQDAFDSGEPLLMPCGEAVSISDVGLVANHPLHLVGHGADTAAAASCASMFRSNTPGIQFITIKPTAHNSRLSGFHIQADAAGSTGIVLGDGVTDHLRGAVIESVSTNPSLHFGIHVLGAGGFVIDKCWLWGSDSALRLENLYHSDTGDNKITDSDFNAGPAGAGIRWTTGGGLYVKGCKFGAGYNHIYMDWGASSGNFNLTGCSLETCTHISVDMRGSSTFKRAQLVGNTWGGVILAVAVRNFSPTNWLEELLIEGNTIDNNSGNPCMDIGCVSNAFITGNTIRSSGGSVAGIMLRNGNGAVGQNKIIGCASPVVVAGGTWNVQPQL